MPLILDAKKAVKPFLNCVHLHFFKKLGMEFLLENFEATHVEILKGLAWEQAFLDIDGNELFHPSSSRGVSWFQ